MSTPNHNITQVVERAVRAYLLANLPSWLPETQVYRGIENRDAEDMEGEESSVRRYPCIIAICQSANAVLENWSGIWGPKLEVQIWSNRSQTTGDDHDARAQEVLNLFAYKPFDLALLIRDAFTERTSEALSLRSAIIQETGYRAEGNGWCTYATFNLEQCSQP